MKKRNTVFALLVLLISLASCRPDDKEYKTSNFELRQMVKETNQEVSASGSFFIAVGSFSHREKSVTTVKVFAKVENRYRLIEVPIEDVRVDINNEIKTPFVFFEYKRSEPMEDEDVANHSNKLYWIDGVMILTCPEEYLPEKLVPLTL